MGAYGNNPDSTGRGRITSNERRQTAPAPIAGSAEQIYEAVMDSMYKSGYQNGTWKGASPDHQRLAYKTTAAERSLLQAKTQNGDLQSGLEAHERRKLKFTPTPSRFGMKFANKSEEQRYLKVCSKIMMMEHMDPATTEAIYLHI